MIAVGLALVVLPAVASAQEQGWAAKFFQGELNHNFGNVPWGAQLTHKFTITNIYNVPFVVEDATVSCGCVSVKKPAGVIPPRGTAELEANMDTRKAGATGKPKIVNVFVRLSSVPQNPGEKVFASSTVLSVQCLAQTNIRYSHEKMQFGVVNLGQQGQSQLFIEHFVAPGFDITGVVPHNEPVDVTVEKVQPRMGGLVGYRVVATLKTNAPAGEIKYEVQLKTNDPVTPVLDVVMEGIIQAPLVASPNNRNVGNVKVGEVVSMNVVIRGQPGKAFKVMKVEGEGDGFKAKFQSTQAAPAHVIQIDFVPEKAGKISKTLTIKTDLPGDLSANVVVEGTGVQ
jgi:hypothetical protein